MNHEAIVELHEIRSLAHGYTASIRDPEQGEGIATGGGDCGR